MTTYKLAAALLCFALAPAVGAVQHSRKDTELLQNHAKRLLSESFSGICGARGEYCGFVINGDRRCAREFILTFPRSLSTPEKHNGVLWVTLDREWNVAALSLTEEGSCSSAAPRTTAS